MCLSGCSFCDLPSAILVKLKTAAILLTSITLYIYNNIIVIFQFKTNVKTREKRSAVRWQLINRPWFAASADGDGSKGEVQNKYCYILQNKNQKNYWKGLGSLPPPPTSRYAPGLLAFCTLFTARTRLGWGGGGWGSNGTQCFLNNLTTIDDWVNFFCIQTFHPIVI